MSTDTLKNPASSLQFGISRVDITPPVGIYHPLWGAARHYRATGVHRPLTAEVMVFEPFDSSDSDSQGLIRVQLDLPGLVKSQHESLRQTVADASGWPVEQVILSYSHTHAAGWFVPDRIPFPGGDLIEPYLDALNAKLHDACLEALENRQPVMMSYAFGRCSLAANRDYRDEERGIYTCGFNPDTKADDTVTVARVTDQQNALVASIVNYACHPTSLAWENTLISPDYVGAMRETVEEATGALCVFTLGACGELGPRNGFSGDTEVADSNGRQLGFAALSALASMDPPATDFHYDGPVLSGATLGTWKSQEFDNERTASTRRFGGGRATVDLASKPKPDADSLARELADWQDIVVAADERGDTLEARNASARAERARRWLARLDNIPDGDTFPLEYSVYRFGDGIWITCGGEPYNTIISELRRRFPDETLIFSPVSGDLQVAYLLPADRYGLGLYQEEPSILAPGCLEALIETISERIEKLA